MNARIHTVEQYLFGNKGKTSRISPSSLVVAPRSRRLPTGEERKWLEIRATGGHQSGTGDRGGDLKIYKDTLTLNLELKDLSEIFRVAVANGFVGAKAVEYLLQAQSNLEKAIAEMVDCNEEASIKRVS